MIIKRKLFSFKRTMAGIKGGLKYVPKGMKIGAIVAPGNGIAYLAGKKKLAAGITAAGALTGGGLGYMLGRKEALDKYDYDYKMQNDPEFRAAKEKEEKEELEKIRNTKYPGFPSVSHFKEGERKYNVKFDPVIYRYFGWLKKFYEKNWSRWYKSIDSNSDYFNFSYIFLLPADEEYAFMDIEYNNTPDFMLLCDPICGSDHQWLYYHSDEGYYNFPLGFGYDSKTFIGCLENYVSQFIKNSKYLNNIQLSIIKEYINNIKQLN